MDYTLQLPVDEKFLTSRNDYRDEVIALKEVSRDDTHLVANYLERDLGHVTLYLSETRHEFKERFGFYTLMIEAELLDLLFKAADPAIVKLNEFRQTLEQLATRHVGEITAPGILMYEKCGEKLHFRLISKLPPCIKGHRTIFHRQSN